MPYYLWNHHRIFYREKGEGPLLILLPGNTSSSVNMQSEVAYFSKRFRAVSIVFFGTRQVNGLVQEIGVEHCILVGTSGGAVTALLAAIHYPEMVRGVIADSFIPYLSGEMLESILIPDRKNPNSGQIRFWEAAHGPYWKQIVDEDTAMIERFVRRGGDWFAGKLPKVKCPVLLTASKVDPVLPEVAGYMAEMAGQITRSRVYLHNEGVHPLIWSAPRVFRVVCDFFLDSLK